MANILISFEESQVVMSSFLKKGHNSYSNDLKITSGQYVENHLQMDVYDAIDYMYWDFIGLHPVCTKMTLSGNRHYANGKPKYKERIDSVEWTIKLWKHVCSRVKYAYMENPMGVMNTDYRLPKPQIIQPYYFGDEYQKTTCLWLHGLPPLEHRPIDDLFGKSTHVSKGEMITFKSGKVMPKWISQTPSKN